MRTLIVPVLVTIAIALAAGPAHAAGSTSPGKNSVHASADNVPLNGTLQLTAQILKGKKKTVLEIDATARVNALPAENVVGLLVIVNNSPLVLQPAPAYHQFSFCDNSFPCVAHALYWLDIDAAELASPGTFVGQPLDVALYPTLVVGTGMETGDVSLRVRVVKK